jgi:hypothetical protein
MKTAIRHLRANTVAYLALFVALGGTGYAAISIPAGSVGTRQLRNGAVTANKLARGSVTPAKLDARSIAGSVVFWAKIVPGGQVIASSEPATTSDWSTGFGHIVFRGRVTSRCFALGSGLGEPGGVGIVAVQSGPSTAGQENLGVSMFPAGSTQLGPVGVVVAVICPN